MAPYCALMLTRLISSVQAVMETVSTSYSSGPKVTVVSPVTPDWVLAHWRASMRSSTVTVSPCVDRWGSSG